MAWIRQEDVPFGNVIKIMSINEGAMKAVQGVNQAVTFGASASHPDPRGSHRHRCVGGQPMPLL